MVQEQQQPHFDPTLAGSLHKTVRQLLADERWSEVADEVDRDLEQGPWQEPLELECTSAKTYVEVLDILHAHGGADLILDLATRRFHEVSRGALLGPIYRGWLRSFPHVLPDLFRVLPYIWAAATKGCGVLHVSDIGERAMAIELQNPPQYMLESVAFRIYCAGHATAYAEASGQPFTYQFSVSGDTLRNEIVW